MHHCFITESHDVSLYNILLTQYLACIKIAKFVRMTQRTLSAHQKPRKKHSNAFVHCESKNWATFLRPIL